MTKIEDLAVRFDVLNDDAQKAFGELSAYAAALETALRCVIACRWDIDRPALTRLEDANDAATAALGIDAVLLSEVTP